MSLLKFESTGRTRFFTMTETVRIQLMGKLKSRFSMNPKNEYYKFCMDNNDVFCIKCRNAIQTYEELVGKHGLGRTSVWNYYHRDCFQRLYQ